MLAGRPAFGTPLGGLSQDVRDDIAHYVRHPRPSTLRWPSHAPKDAKDLVAALLTPDPDRRLKTAAAVKAHPFFARVSWPDMAARRYDAPWIPPPMRFPGDVTNFDLYLRMEGETVVGRGAAARVLYEKPPPSLGRAFTAAAGAAFTLERTEIMLPWVAGHDGGCAALLRRG